MTGEQDIVLVMHSAGEDAVHRDSIRRGQGREITAGVVIVTIEADPFGVEADVHDTIRFVAGERTGIIIGQSSAA